jgi:hypothetical protein
MAKHPTEIIQQNTERAMEAADVSLHWFRQATEQNFKQSKAAVEELIELTRRMTGSFGVLRALHVPRRRNPLEHV